MCGDGIEVVPVLVSKPQKSVFCWDYQHRQCFPHRLMRRCPILAHGIHGFVYLFMVHWARFLLLGGGRRGRHAVLHMV